MATRFAGAFFPLLLLSGTALAMAGCTGPSARTATNATATNPCAGVVVSGRQNPNGALTPPACDEHLERLPPGQAPRESGTH